MPAPPTHPRPLPADALHRVTDPDVHVAARQTAFLQLLAARRIAVNHRRLFPGQPAPEPAHPGNAILAALRAAGPAISAAVAARRPGHDHGGDAA